MTRQCTCGGIIRQHQLTGEREAWTCGGCGRYGAIARGGDDMSDGVMLALRAAVNIARNDGVERIGLLRLRLVDRGFSEADTDAALRYWATREAGALA